MTTPETVTVPLEALRRIVDLIEATEYPADQWDDGDNTAYETLCRALAGAAT